MTKAYPHPLQAAILPSVVIATGFFLFMVIDGQAWGISIVGTLLIFLISTFSFFAVLKFMVYKRINHLTARREKEIRKLKEMEVFRREFLGDVSHELKTPIFAIEGFIETLLDGALEDKKVNRKFLQKALKHSERLSTLVQDILVITQVESGDLLMNTSKFNMHTLVQETVDSLGNKFTKKGRDIDCKINSNGQEDVQVIADKERIEQVLYNLIDNAVKYGDAKGEIEISLEPFAQKLLLKVKDNGKGIDPEHLPRLFERFYRVDKSRSREKGGTGLGLSICKHLIEAHGEKIWAESEPGKGATFQFTLTPEVKEEK